MNMPSTNKKPIHELSQPELFQKIGEICSAVNIAISVKELLSTSLRKTLELFGAKRGSIFILSEDRKELILKIAQGMEISEQEKLVKRLGEGIVGKVAETKKPLFVNDISQDSRFQGYRQRKSYRTPSFICTPLIIKDTLIGVINIADKECGSSFSQEELQLLDFLASQIALNYRRTQLHQKFKGIVKESKNLKDELGKTTEVTDRLMRQIIAQDRLASIGKLAGGIAHELNNPLDGVLRYVNLSLDHLKDDDIIRGYLLEAKDGIKRMVNIVRSLLACSRNSPPTMKKIDVNGAVEEVITSIEPDIFHKNISIKKTLSHDLPQIIDLGIERVVSNILRNSIDAVNNGGEIAIKTALNDNSLIVEIKDTGCGITEDVKKQMFEPFFTTKDIEKGCGLGLTIVSEIVKSYNGTIDIQSAPEKGTTFIITLPIQENYGEKGFNL